MAQVPPKPAGSGPMRPTLMTFRRLGGRYSSLTCISRDIIRARETEGHPCLTALRRPWLRADRHRLAPTSMSRKPAPTLGCPPASRGPNARRGRERRRERAGHGRPASGRRFERSQGWRSEIKRAAPSRVSSCGGARNASQPLERQAGDALERHRTRPLGPRLGCQLAANNPLHATAEAGFGGRRYRVNAKSALATA